jgi:hypothetical protein
MTETYEQKRESSTGEAGAVWKAADREENNLRALYRRHKTASPTPTAKGVRHE